LLLIAGLVISTVAMRSSARHATAPARYAGTRDAGRSWPLTTTVPKVIRRTCRADPDKRGLRVPVLCPRAVPAGGIDLRLGFGLVRSRSDFYWMEFHSALHGESLHWVVGAGAPTAIRRYELSGSDLDDPSDAPRLYRTRSTRTGVIALYRSPDRWGAGHLAGHITVVGRRAGELVYASVHGYEHEAIAIGVLESMIEP
jgi:hypothetical protein